MWITCGVSAMAKVIPGYPQAVYRPLRLYTERYDCYNALKFNYLRMIYTSVLAASSKFNMNLLNNL